MNTSATAPGLARHAFTARSARSARSALLALALLAGGTAAATAFAGEARPVATTTATNGERQWLSIGQVFDRLEAAGYRQIEKIEREDGRYEARATDRNGVRSKLYIHPQTGEIRERGSERMRRDGESGASADCTRRRCRDDLPATASGR